MSTEKTIHWKRPSGNELITDDSKATIEYLESLGFEQIKPGRKPAEKAKTE